MLKSDSIAAVAAALSDAQGEFPPILREKEVTVATSGSPYTFAYAPLEVIMASIKKPLAKYGLALVQTVISGEGGDFIRTTLTHDSGEWLAGDTPIYVRPDKNGVVTAQAYGSGITYARRYGVSSLLCLSTDEDDDGNASTGNAITKSRTTASGAKRAAAVKRIDGDQVEELRQGIEATGTDEAAFCKFLGVKKLEDLPVDRFDHAKHALQAKADRLAAESEG